MNKCFAGGHLRYVNGAWRDVNGDTVDAVDVVRCKDCEFYSNEECGCPYIFMSDGAHLYTDPTDFCSYGERREDNEID